MDLSYLGFFLVKGLEISAPIAFAALGGVFSERGGVVNIALEGIMTVTSLTLVWGAIAFQSIWAGLAVAVLTGMLMGLLHAVVTITFKVDHVVSGVAINIFAIGLSRFLCQSAFGQETQSAINSRMFPMLLGINSLAFWLVPIVALSWFVINRTVFGLRLRSVGENPEAADTLGVNVTLMRYAGVIISGALCGLGSATLFADKWISGMVAGRGFMALAAVIFGRWSPLGAVLASLLFGYADTVRIVFETRIPIPVQFVQMFPYVLALVVLAGLAGRSRAPAADGRNFEKGLG
ncbi:MAG: ABC transporter permease [Spirochaetes bacterium]|nr:ABC transporter permease [Spirochaetota bacterium]